MEEVLPSRKGTSWKHDLRKDEQEVGNLESCWKKSGVGGIWLGEKLWLGFAG